MLDLAINHSETLKKLFRDTWFSEKYKFWNCSNYYDEHETKEGPWNSHQFVSVDSNGEVIGYIAYSIDRANDLVDGLSIINFTDNKATFGIDTGNAIKDIFEKFHFRKISFCVVIGNPIEHTYDRMTEKYNGCIVGTQKQHVKLFDGKLYDMKLYEIFAEDYFRR